MHLIKFNIARDTCSNSVAEASSGILYIHDVIGLIPVSIPYYVYSARPYPAAYRDLLETMNGVQPNTYGPGNVIRVDMGNDRGVCLGGSI